MRIGLLMLDSIEDPPKGRWSPNKQWVLKLLSRFMTRITKWVRGSFEDLAHVQRGTAIDGWWCQDPYFKEKGFFLLVVGAGGRVAWLITLRVWGFNKTWTFYKKNQSKNSHLLMLQWNSKWSFWLIYAHFLLYYLGGNDEGKSIIWWLPSPIILGYGSTLFAIILPFIPWKNEWTMV